MISLDAPILQQRVDLLLSTKFGFEANPHPENVRSAEAGQQLLAAQVDVQGDGDLAAALREDLSLR